jgi:hypothetical protein
MKEKYNLKYENLNSRILKVWGGCDWIHEAQDRSQ